MARITKGTRSLLKSTVPPPPPRYNVQAIQSLRPKTNAGFYRVGEGYGTDVWPVLKPKKTSAPVISGGGVIGTQPKPKRTGRGGGTRAGAVTALPPVPPPLTWSDKYTVEGAPDWWRGLVPSRLSPKNTYLGLINNLIPFLSPEDQQTMASALYRFDSKTFARYNPEMLTIPAPADMDTSIRRGFTSENRGEAVLNALSRFARATGKPEKKLGPGYKFLRNLADVIRDFGGEEEAGQTRTQNTQFRAALDPLLAEVKSGALGAFEPIARALATPFFSAGAVTPVSRAQDGTYVYGTPQKSWY